MPKPRSAPKSASPEHDDSGAVSAFIAALNHPLVPVLAEIRQTILKAAPGITEGIKWNAPSFYFHGWFATANLRGPKGVMIVLHHGAKVKDGAADVFKIADPDKLLTWPSPDRALATFVSAEDFQKKRPAFQRIVKQWAERQARLAGQG